MADFGYSQTQIRGDSLFERVRKRSPTSSQIIGFIALLTTGGISLFLGGLTVTGIVITLVLLTPLFLFFSPILVPAGILIFLCIAGVLTAAGAGVATLSILSWIYNYFKGRHPVGSEHVNFLWNRASETAERARQKTREVGSQAQSRVQGAAPGA